MKFCQAARNGHMETCRWLVTEPGIDPNKATLDGTTPWGNLGEPWELLPENHGKTMEKHGK